MGLGIAEVDQQPVAYIAGEISLKAPNLLGTGLLVGQDHLAQVFGVKFFRERGGAHQITEHHRQLPALSLGSSRARGRCRRRSCRASRPPWCLRAFPLAARGGCWLSLSPQRRTTFAAELG